MGDSTPQSTIERLSNDNARLRQEIESAHADLGMVLMSIIAGGDTPAVIDAKLEKIVQRLDRARRS